MSIKAARDLIVQTDRFQEASAFYEDVLGLELFMRDPAMIGLEAGALRLFVEPGPALGPVLEFLVDDVAAMRDRLVAAGCAVQQEDPSIPRCYIRDPFGLVFNLGQG